MKTGFVYALASLVLLLASLPGPARANPPIECTDGCYVVICNGQLCSLWRCDSAGCRFLSNWPREWSESPVGRSLGSATAKAPPSVAWVKVCPTGRDCDLYEVTVDQAVMVGSFENPAELVRERERLNPPAQRAR